MQLSARKLLTIGQIMPNNTLQRTNLQLYRLRWDMDSPPGWYHAIMPTTAFATKIFEKQQKRSKSKVQPAGNLWPALMALMAWTFHAEQPQNTHHREPKPWQMTSELNINVEILADFCVEKFFESSKFLDDHLDFIWGHIPWKHRDWPDVRRIAMKCY